MEILAEPLATEDETASVLPLPFLLSFVLVQVVYINGSLSLSYHKVRAIHAIGGDIFMLPLAKHVIFNSHLHQDVTASDAEAVTD